MYRYYKFAYQSQAQQNKNKNDDCSGLLGLLNAKCRGNVSRPYKTPGSQGQGQTPSDKAKTPAERVAACQQRVNAHIARINTHPNIPTAEKTAIIAKLNAKLVDCATPHGLDKEEKDKNHTDANPKGYGRLVSQVTPGKLKQNPNILAELLQKIFDFFKNIANPPTPIQRVMSQYPAPPYTTGTVAPRVTTA